MSTRTPLNATKHFASWDEPDETLAIELTRGQWQDIRRALKLADASHEDDEQDSRYNGEYARVVEIIEDAWAS